MGRDALLESLRASAAEERESAWREARAAAETYRSELAHIADEEKTRALHAATELAQRLEGDAMTEARRRIRDSRATAALRLADRCRRLAIDELPRLRTEGGAALFLALADELPKLRWERVQVNPADEELARTTFPSAEIYGDPGIAGGLVTLTENGRIRVDNSLGTRLAMAWPDILPGLVGDLMPEVRNDAAAA